MAKRARGANTTGKAETQTLPWREDWGGFYALSGSLRRKRAGARTALRAGSGAGVGHVERA